MPDLVLRRGGWLEVEIGPGLFDLHLDAVAQATSFCTCPGPPGGADVLLAAGPAGLVELALDPLTDQWSTTTLSGTWADAVLLEVVAQEGAPVQVFGVMADGRSVRRLTDEGGTWADVALFSLPVPAYDLAVVQYDGAGSLELAVATAGALAVFAQNGELVASWVPGGITSVSIGRIDAPQDGRDWIAWVVTRNAGDQLLSVVGQGGMTVPAGMSPTPSIVDMRTGDFDGDGRGDVLLSHTSLHSLVVFLDRGVGAAPVFDYSLPGSLHLIPIGPDGVPAPDNEARPALADVDGDGDVDALMPVQSSSKVFLGRNATIDETALQPVVDVDDPLLAANLSELPGGDLALDLKLEVGTSLPAEATHLELIVWRREDPAVPTAVDACDRQLVELSSGVVVGGQCKLDARVVLPAPPDIVPGTNVRFEGIYLWLQRPVRVEAGAVVCTWPSKVYGLETSPSSANHDWLVSIGGLPSFPVHESSSGTTIPDQIGCGSVLPCLPNFPSGQLPKWN